MLLLESLAAVLCFVPLFDLLSYEFSFAVGLVAAFGAAHLGVHLTSRLRSQGAHISAWSLFALAWLLAAAQLLVLPLLLITLNAARVKVCDYPQGLAFYALLPGITVGCASAVGITAGLVCKRRGLATAISFLVILASLGLSLYRFWAAPPIFAYDPFGGYYPGALYDEDVHVSAPLVLARLMHLLSALTLVAASSVLLRDDALHLDWRLAFRRARLGRHAPLLLFLGGALTLYFLGPRLNIRHDVASIAKALGGRHDTAHFTIYYPKMGEAARAIRLLARDHEYAYEALRRTLGVNPTHVTSFVFSSAEEKRQLMGAAHVDIAKPWRREIFIQYERFPHPVLRHELAHIFAGECAPLPFRIPVSFSAQRPLVNVGLVEGVAVAAAWTGGGRLTPHEWARALDILGKRPRLAAIFGLGFFGKNAATSYTLAGSFSRFLLEKYGPRPLCEAYRSGGDYRRSHGKSLEELEQEWVAFIRQIELRPDDIELARARFARPTVFAMPCAHTIAERRQKASLLARGGALGEAADTLRAVCKDAPFDAETRLELARVLEQAGRHDEALELLLELANLPLPPATRAHVLSDVADLEIRQGRLSEAQATLSKLLSLPSDDVVHRSARARLFALSEPRLKEPLLAALVGHDPGPRDGAIVVLSLREAVAQAPTLGIGHYLLGRQLYLRGKPKEAIPWLERAASLPLPDEAFRLENLRTLGYAAFEAGMFDRSQRAFDELRLAASARTSLRLEAQDMLERIAFESQPSPDPRR